MRNFFRLLKYLRRHWQRFSLGMAVMLICTLFGGISITMLYPIFNQLFDQPAGEIIIQEYDPRPLLPQISEELQKSKPSEELSGREYYTALGANLKENFQSLLKRNHPQKILGFLCIAFMIILFIKALTFYFYHLIFGVLEEVFSKEMRDELFARINTFSLAFFSRFRTGDLISRMVSDIEFIKRVVVANVAEFIYNIAQVIMYFSLAMLINFKLAVFAILVTPPIILILAYIAKKLKKYSYRSQVKAAGIVNVLEESIAAFKIILAFVRHKFQQAKFSRETDRFYRTRVKMVKYDFMNRPVSEFLSTVLGVVILWYGGKMILNPESHFDAAAFAVFIAALYSTFQPLRTLSRIYNDLQKGLGVAVRYFEIYDQKPDITSPPDGKTFRGLQNGIEFENVSFSYDGNIVVLNEINMTIKSGEVVALVGPSGGGKTTLTSLIPRFYDTTAGRISFDDVDIRDFTLDSLRGRIGIVTQETLLFHDTVFNNIAFGQPDTPMNKVKAAAEAANAHDFIMELPDKYDTIIGERGSRLSGGQKQRITIARAIINNPDLLIFDEATSSLDSEAERLIQEAMENIVKGRTVIIIAHRLSTIRHANRILVVENGEIVEEGMHEELMAGNGAYRRLYNLQYWLEPDVNNG